MKKPCIVKSLTLLCCMALGWSVSAQTGVRDLFSGGSLSCEWSGEPEYTLAYDDVYDNMSVQANVASNTFKTFSLSFPSINLTGNATISMDIYSSEPMELRVDLGDANGRFTNAVPVIIDVAMGFDTYTFSITNFNQTFPSAATVTRSTITSVLFFVNPGGTAITNSFSIDNLTIGVAPFVFTDGGLSSCSPGGGSSFPVSTNIRLNQIGYYNDEMKKAVLVGTHAAGSFVVKNASSGAVAFTGTLGAAATWNRSNETARILDFSTLTTPGSYYIEVPGSSISSYTFQINDRILVGVNKAAIKYFYFHRASTAISATHGGIYARAAGHPDNIVRILPSAASAARPAGTIVSSPKGWYDAGDYNCYVVNSGIATYTMLAAYEQFKSYYDTLYLNIPESGNSMPDMLDEIKWNLDWMLTMQDPNDGGVYFKKTSANFNGEEMPADDDDLRYMCAKSTTAALDFAAVMAVASRVYQPWNSTYANTCRAAAISAYNWALTNNNIGFTNPGASGGYPAVFTGGYGDSNFSDEFEWAATELFITTGTTSYYSASFKNANTYDIPAWPSVRTLGLLSLIRHRRTLPSVAMADTTNMKAKLTSLASGYVSYATTSAYHTAMGLNADNFVWGSNGVASNIGMVIMSAYQMNKSQSYLDAAISVSDYLLGRNGTGFSFVSGYGSRTPLNQHDRISESDGIAAPIPGMLSGGPHNQDGGDGCPLAQPATRFCDVYSSYATNEIAINWNAPFVFLTSSLEVVNILGGGVVTSQQEQETVETTMMLFPNPATDVVTIASNETVDTWTLLNTTGAEVLRGVGSEVNVSGMVPGVYHVRVNTNNNTRVLKLVVQ